MRMFPSLASRHISGCCKRIPSSPSMRIRHVSQGPSYVKQKHRRGLAFSEDLQRIRNIGIAAHIDAGKTTTTERMLYYAGLTSMLGDVDHGDTVTDYLEQERKRGITITSAAVSFPWRDHTINLIDTPGHVDFTIEVERALRVLDGTVVVLDASAGVQAQTLTIWRQGDHYEIPRLIFLNKMDKPRADIEKSLASIEKKLRVEPLLTQLLLGEGRKIKGLIDLVSLERIIWTDDGKKGMHYSRFPISDPEERDLALKARGELLESAADLDDALATQVLNADSLDAITSQDLQAALRRITLARQAYPVFLGAASRNIGIQPLMDAVVSYLPSPTERKTDAVSLYAKNSLVAFAFKITHDAHLGVITFVRIYSGQIRAGDRVYNVNRATNIKVNKVYIPFANEFKEVDHVPAGNIGVISGFKDVLTGDTICQSETTANAARQRADLEGDKEGVSQAAVVVPGKKNPVLIGIETPDPVFFCSIEPPSLSAQKDLDYALECFQREDPSLTVRTDEETGQTILGGQGELHLEILKDRILKEYGVDADIGRLQVAYREAMEEFPKDTIHFERHLGDRLQTVKMTLSLQKPSEQREMVRVKPDRESAENLSHLRPNHLAAVKRGLQGALNHGPILNYPVVDIHFGLHWLEVGRGTTDIVVAAAASALAIRLFKAASPVLHQPVMDVVVTVDEAYFSQVLSDLTSRKAQILEIQQHGELKTVVGIAPLANLVGYSTAVRTLSSGLASVSLLLRSYHKMSAEEQAKVIQREGGSVH